MARVKRAVNGKSTARPFSNRPRVITATRAAASVPPTSRSCTRLQYAYRDRRARKGDFRSLWIQRINAATREHGMSYSRFISGLRAAGVEVDRKVLADLAVTDPAAFARARRRVAEAGHSRRCVAERPALSRHHQRVQRLRHLVNRRTARDTERVFVLEGSRSSRRRSRAGIAGRGGVRRARLGASPCWTTRHARGRAGVRARRPASWSRSPTRSRPRPSSRWRRTSTCRSTRSAGADFVVVLRRCPRPGQRRHGAAHRRGRRSGGGSVLRRFGRRLQPEDRAGVRRRAVPCSGRDGGDPVEVLERSGCGACSGLGTVARGGADYRRRRPRRPIAFVLGNEAHGLPDAVMSVIDDASHDPDGGPAESLNVGMAAAVLCFEAARQRRAGCAVIDARPPARRGPPARRRRAASSRPTAPPPRSPDSRHADARRPPDRRRARSSRAATVAALLADGWHASASLRSVRGDPGADVEIRHAAGATSKRPRHRSLRARRRRDLEGAVLVLRAAERRTRPTARASRSSRRSATSCARRSRRSRATRACCSTGGTG